jgi:hypothetical protein
MTGLFFRHPELVLGSPGVLALDYRTGLIQVSVQPGDAEMNSA